MSNLVTVTLDLDQLPAAISASIAAVLRQKGLEITDADLREMGNNVSAVVALLDVGAGECQEVITADTITDEQIRELRDNAWDWFDDVQESNAAVTECSLALAKFRDSAGLATVRLARARCAAIINARQEVQP